MKANEAQQWLARVYYLYSTEPNADTSKRMEVYLLSRLIDLYARYNDGSYHGLGKSRIWTVVVGAIKATIQTHKLKETDPLSALLKGPETAEDFRCAQAHIKTFLSEPGDLAWMNMCLMLSDEVDTACAISAAKNPEPMTTEGLMRYLIEHLQGFNTLMKGQVLSLANHQLHTQFMLKGAAFYAVLYQLLTLNPSLRLVPAASAFCAQSDIMSFVNMLKVAQVKAEPVSQPVLPIHVGEKLSVDHELIHVLQTMSLEISASYEGSPDYQNTKMAVESVLEAIVERNRPANQANQGRRGNLKM